jgi:hypothetical protein
MSYGRLGVSNPLNNTSTILYTVPSTCLYAIVSVYILNYGIADTPAEIAISATSTPTDEEYIEKGAIIPALGGILERTDITCSPGENIVIRVYSSDTSVRVSGREIIAL